MNERWKRIGLPLAVAAAVAWWMLGGSSTSEEDEIRRLLAEGERAWEAKDLDRFMSFFAREFTSRSGELNYGVLLLFHKERGIFDPQNTLDATIENVRVRVSGTTATAAFDGRATVDPGTGPVPLVGAEGTTPIALELEKRSAVRGLPGEWKIVASSGLEEGYAGDR